MIKVNFRVSSNSITSDLRRALRSAQNAEPALRAAASVVMESAKRAFRESELRPTAWQQLAAKTIEAKKRAGKSTAMLIRDAHLIRTPRIVMSDKRRAIVGSNLFYARFHQLGTARIPARPFWPFDASGRMTPRMKAVVTATMRRKLAITK